MPKQTTSFALAIMLALIISPVSAAKDTAGAQNAVQQQAQTSNQGEATMLQTQTQTETNASEETGNGVATQDQAQPQNREQVQSQAQVQTETQTLVQTQNQEQTQTKTKKNATEATENTQQVMNQLQAQLQTQTQTATQTRLRELVEVKTTEQEQVMAQAHKLETRDNVEAFFFGPDFKAIKNLNGTVTANRERISELETLKLETTDATELTALALAIEALDTENTSLQETIDNKKNDFSLFGWLVGFFS